MILPSRTPPLRELICSKNGLGYCCPFAFFSCFRKLSSAQIAERLGCTRQAVARLKRRFELREFACEGAKSCMKEALTKSGKISPG